MARSHLKVYLDFDERTSALDDEEKARLLLAMVRYCRDGKQPEPTGNERFLWPVFQGIIDRDIAAYNTKVENGAKKGKAAKAEKSETKRNEADKSEQKRNEAECHKNEEGRRKNEELRVKNEEQRNKSEEEEQENTPSPEGDEGAGGFEDFWLIYPRKQGKQDARKAWEKLAPNGELLFRIQASVLAQKQSGQWTREGGRYIPLPATWLNGRRWEDEAGPAPEPAKQKTVSAQQYTQRVYTEAELLAVSDDLFEEARKYRTTSPENQTPA